VSDLAAQGFPLAGGRIDYLQNQAAAALVYRHGEHIINVFVWPGAHPGDSRPVTRTLRGYHLLQWSKAGLTYCAVSDMDIAEMRRLADLLQAGPP